MMWVLETWIKLKRGPSPQRWGQQAALHRSSSRPTGAAAQGPKGISLPSHPLHPPGEVMVQLTAGQLLRWHAL